MEYAVWILLLLGAALIVVHRHPVAGVVRHRRTVMGAAAVCFLSGFLLMDRFGVDFSAPATTVGMTAIILGNVLVDHFMGRRKKGTPSR